jgi:predicted HTH domain antitoxin
MEEIYCMSDNVLEVDLPPNLSEDEAKLLLAIKLYEVGKVSLGQAAKLAGFSKRAFMEMLGRYKVPVFNYSPEELRQEIDT